VSETVKSSVEDFQCLMTDSLTANNPTQPNPNQLNRGINKPSGVPSKMWGAMAARWNMGSHKNWARWEATAAEGLVETQVLEELVMTDKARLRKGRFETLVPSSPPVPRDGTIRLFLDHGGVSWHQEVFYAVAKNMERAYRKTHNSKVEFILEEQNFRTSYARWEKHVTDLTWSTLRHDKFTFRSIAPCCDERQTVQPTQGTFVRSFVRSLLFNGLYA